MALFSFFKRPKHQRFEYKPRYWNPEREELNERVRRAQRDSNDPEAMKSRISSGLRRSYKLHASRNSNAYKRSNFRLLLIVGIILVLCYYFVVVYLPKFEEFLR